MHIKSNFNNNLDLEKKLLASHNKIESWLRKKWDEHKPPFYGSADIRNSIYKISPVDMNLFPGGFNNLNEQFIHISILAIQEAISRINTNICSILIIPENHTRNTFYFENIYTLQKIMTQAGFIVRIGSVNPLIKEKTELKTASNNSIYLEPIIKDNKKIKLKDGFTPDFILLNNDLSSGIINQLTDIEQNILPPINAGWFKRRKSDFFTQFDTVINDFTTNFDIDPWFISPYFKVCNKLNFQDATGEECLLDTIDLLLTKINNKYKEYNINDKPFLMVKADAGTYGMGIMTVTSANDIKHLNRKSKNKMSTIKGGMNVEEVIIQEGIYTFEKINGSVAEPVVYMIDKFVVGGFYRTHEGRKINENLNASGMKLIPLKKSIINNEDDILEYQDKRKYKFWEDLPIINNKNDNKFYTYGIIARLALLAASLELKNL